MSSSDTGELHQIHNRPFTPDGHLVGSLGEVLAAEILGLTLMPPSTEGYDAIDQSERKVEIKATYGTSVALRESSDIIADDLVVLKLDQHQPPEIVY